MAVMVTQQWQRTQHSPELRGENGKDGKLYIMRVLLPEEMGRKYTREACRPSLFVLFPEPSFRC